MYNKKEMKMLAAEFLNDNKSDIVSRLEDLQTQLSNIQMEFKPKMANPKLDANTIHHVMTMDLNHAEKNILLHFLAMESQGMTEVYISGAADSINMKRPAYAKTVRKLAEKGYIQPTVKRAVYKLNKVF